MNKELIAEVADMLKAGDWLDLHYFFTGQDTLCEDVGELSEHQMLRILTKALDTLK